MQTKTIEIRDRMTFIAALAIRLDPGSERDRYLLARAGFGRDPEAQSEYVVLVRLNGGGASWDCFSWGDRTMHTAHQWLTDHFGEIESGAVVDVEFILGEKEQPARSEASL